MSTGYEYPRPQRVAGNATVEANANSATLTVANMGKVQSNTGAGAGIALTLPAASAVGGCALLVAVTAAQTVDIKPISTDKVFLNGNGVANKYCRIAGTVGNYATVFSDGSDWVIGDYSGVLTKEA